MPQSSSLKYRLAQAADLTALRALASEAIRELQKGFLDERQIAASTAIMGIDTLLVEDETYFVVEHDGDLAGCGGWSRWATLYGGDASPGRDPALLDPATEPARIRAMYTHPDHTRKGVGRLILALCEAAARAEGFSRAELMATLSGEPLYRACGYLPIEEVIRFQEPDVRIDPVAATHHGYPVNCASRRGSSQYGRSAPVTASASTSSVACATFESTPRISRNHRSAGSSSGLRAGRNSGDMPSGHVTSPLMCAPARSSTTTISSSGYARRNSSRNASKQSPSRCGMYKQQLSPVAGSTAA